MIWYTAHKKQLAQFTRFPHYILYNYPERNSFAANECLHNILCISGVYCVSNGGRAPMLSREKSSRPDKGSPWRLQITFSGIQPIQNNISSNYPCHCNSLEIRSPRLLSLGRWFRYKTGDEWESDTGKTQSQQYRVVHSKHTHTHIIIIIIIIIIKHTKLYVTMLLCRPTLARRRLDRADVETTAWWPINLQHYLPHRPYYIILIVV